MKNYGLFLSIFCFGLLLINCGSKVEATLPTVNYARNFSTPEDSCDKYQRIFNELPDWAKKELKEKNITLGGDGYFIGESLVDDCELRLKIGGYIRKIISGTYDETDIKFAERHSAKIVPVIKHTWNYHSDGARHEKYGLLHKYSGLKDEDVAPFISQLLGEEELVPEAGEPQLFYVMLSRPLPALKTQISNFLMLAEKRNDFTGQVYALYLLHRDGFDGIYSAKMRKIIKNPNLPDAAKPILEKIVSKIEKREEVDFELLEDFGYAVVNNKSPLK